MGIQYTGAIMLPQGGFKVVAAAPAVFSGDPHWDNVSLLINFDGGSVSDVSSTNQSIKVSNVPVDTNIKRYGSGSGQFLGTALSYLRIDETAALNFGTADWTIEYWANRAATSSGQMPFTIGNASYHGMYLEGVNFYNPPNNTPLINTGNETTANTWVHVAAVRNGTTVSLYFDGVSQGDATIDAGTIYDDTSDNQYSGSFFGSYVAQSYPVTAGITQVYYPWTGYLDEIRVTKNVARYTENFTPPSEAFPTP